MKRTASSALFLLATLAPPIFAAGKQQAAAGDASKTPKAATKAAAAPKPDPVKRLQPSEVPGLPAEFLDKLNTRGCTIPQFDSGGPPAGPEPTNVIHGEFARHGQEDWAVLCSNGRSSTIVIFWGKPTACPASLARLDDAHYLKPASDKPREKTLHYSRMIQVLSDGELDDRPGLGSLKPLAHQGIDDRFVGKSSAFFYCNEGKWRIFPAKEVILVQ